MARDLAIDARLFLAARVFNGVLGIPARLGGLHPDASPAKHHVERLSNIRYREGTRGSDHLLDVWRPKEIDAGKGARRRHRGPPWPIVIYVHGGAFSILSKDSHWMMALAFARRGFLVFNINHRLAPRHRFPAAIEDVCHAFDWVVKNAARFGGDVSRITLSGESAGANLVTGLQMALAYERPEPFAKVAWQTGITPSAVIPACGLLQVSNHARFIKPHMPKWVADRLWEAEASYLGRGPWPCSLDFADPLVFFERGERPQRPLAPFFMPVGTRDPLISDTRRMGAALRALGGQATEQIYPGEAHAFHAFVHKPSAQACWSDIFDFLHQHVPFPEG